MRQTRLLLILLLLFCFRFAGADVTGGKLIYAQNGSLYSVEISASGSLLPGRMPHRIVRLPRGSKLGHLSVSADGSLMALILQSDQDNHALWLVADRPGAQLKRVGYGVDPAFAPTGRQLAYTALKSDYYDRWKTAVTILDPDTGRRRVLRPQSHTPCWSADGREIAFIDESKNDFTATVMLVDAATGKRVLFHREAINIDTPLISPNDRYIAYNPEMSRPKLPGVIEDRKTGNSFELPYAGAPVLDWSADSNYLLWTRYIIAPHNNGTYLWLEIWTTTADGKRSHRVGAGISACFAPDGRHVLYTRITADEHARPLGLYVADLQAHQHRLFQGCEDVFVVWKPQRKLQIETATKTHTDTQDFAAWHLIRTIKDPKGEYGEYGRIFISPDGTIMVSVCNQFHDDGLVESLVIIRDLKTCRILHTLRLHALFYTLAFSPDSRFLAVGGQGDVFEIWNVKTGKLVHSLIGSDSKYYALTYSPDGHLIAGGGRHGFVGLWNAQTGKLLRSTRAFFMLDSLTFSPNGRDIFASGGDRDGDSIKLQNARTGKRVKTISMSENSVGDTTLSLSHDGMIVAGGRNNALRLWEVSSGKLLQTLSDHRNDGQDVSFLAFAKNDQTLLELNDNGTVRLWDLKAHRIIQILKMRLPIKGVAFLSDFKILATICADGSIGLWRLDRIQIRTASIR